MGWTVTDTWAASCERGVSRREKDMLFDAALRRAEAHPDYLVIDLGIGYRQGLVEITRVGKRGAVYGRRLYRHGDKGAERQWQRADGGRVG